MVYCIVYLQLKYEDVGACLYHNVGTAKDAFHLGVDSGVKHGERHVEQQFVEVLFPLFLIPLLLGYDVVGYLSDICTQGDKGIGEASFENGSRHLPDKAVAVGCRPFQYQWHQTAYHAVAHLKVGIVKDICAEQRVVAVYGKIAALVKKWQRCLRLFT